MATKGSIVLTTDESVPQIPLFFAMAIGGFTVALIISKIANCIWKKFRKPDQRNEKGGQINEIGEEYPIKSPSDTSVAESTVDGVLKVKKNSANGEETLALPYDRIGVENEAFSSEASLHNSNKFESTSHAISDNMPQSS